MEDIVNDTTNAMTIDVEDYYHVSAFARHIDRRCWGSYPSRVASNTARLLDILAEHGVRATFFVLGWVAERCPCLVKSIAAAEHEVACHGYSHELVYRQHVTVFREETHRAKNILEDLAQQPVDGYRAAGYSITRQSWWALDVLADLGFIYDSSIFPSHHPEYGIPDAARAPHWLTTPAGYTIAEFPPATVEFGRYRLPVGGGGYFRLLPYFLTRTLLRRINRDERRPFVFYLHPWELDTAQPRIQANALARFRHYNNIDKCEARLRRLLGDFRFQPARAALIDLGLIAPVTMPTPRMSLEVVP